MNIFEYRHEPSLSQEFVNGSYELGEVRHIAVAGHDILYRVGSATLDNSCCGNFGCGFGLVIGEALETRATTPIVSTVRAISADDALAETIAGKLKAAEALGVVNFYVNPQPAGAKA